MAGLSTRHCKCPYRSPAHILSTTYNIAISLSRKKWFYQIQVPVYGLVRFRYSTLVLIVVLKLHSDWPCFGDMHALHSSVAVKSA